MCKNKHAINGSLLHVAVFGAAVLATTLFGGSAFAAPVTSNGIYEDQTTHVRWEYNLTTDTADQVNPQTLTIRFYDKPADETTVNIPSLSDLISGISEATNDLNTYYLRDADVSAQDAAYGSSYPRVAANAPTTVLDMTNTNKIQIMGVSPIIDPDVETELKFGTGIVIGDTFQKRVQGRVCTNWNRGNTAEGFYYYCDRDEWRDFDATTIPGWDALTPNEQIDYEVKDTDINCITIGWKLDYNETPVTGQCYLYNGDIKSWVDYYGGAFSGYKLKLTNFNSSAFNYLGWYAFKDSTFNDENTTITVEGNTMIGGEIFAGTNVKNIRINTPTYGVGLFKDCQSIESIAYSNNVTKINDDTFAGTNLTSFDSTNTSIKHIGARAFEGAQITQVNFTGIEQIDYRAFKDNDIINLFLPKSINKLGAEIFKANGHMKKLTVAYDTMTSGTVVPIHVVLDNVYRGYSGVAGEPSASIEEVNVIAPYAANEQVKSTHLTMDVYAHYYGDDGTYHDTLPTTGYKSWKNNCGTGYVSSTANYWSYKYDNMCDAMHEPERRWAKPDEKKNVIAPKYFTNLHGLKKIIVGDGYEYIGGSAFISEEGSWDTGGDYINIMNRCEPTSSVCSATAARRIEEISLPDSLKGVGALAFGSAYYPGMKANIPRNIEYIGPAAFKKMFTLDIDVDFPNLVFLGDDAFSGTKVRNVVLHDKLEYMGWAVFHYCYFLNDITIDLDIYDQNNLIIWPTTLTDRDLTTKTCYTYSWGEDCRYQTAADNGYASEFRGMFGQTYGEFPSSDVRDKWGLHYDDRVPGIYEQKYGKIVFTEKAVTAPPLVYDEEYGNKLGYGVVNPENPSLPTSCSGIPFNYMAADLFDISATPWKVLRPYSFNHSVMTELRLPANLEVISAQAFSQAQIDEELILPNTLRVIGDGAFNFGEFRSSQDKHPITITRLPAALEFIGAHAFWGDYNLTADLYAPNLKRVYVEAFRGTHLRDVYIPSSVEWLSGGTFNDIPTLRNITIDADFAQLVTTEPTRPSTYQYLPQSLIDYSGEVAPHFMLMNEVEDNIGFNPSYIFQKFETFYTIFNQTNAGHRNWVQNVGYVWEPEYQINANEQYGTLTFGPHAVTDVDSVIGLFAGMHFEKVDLGQAKWTNIGNNTNAFYKSKIGTLILPKTVETITPNAFMYAEITNPVTFPASLRTIGSNAFQWAKIGGLAFEEGLTTISSNAFWRAEINGGAFALPKTLREIGSVAFMEVTGSGKISNMLPEGVQTVGGAAFYQTDLADNLTIPSTVTEIGWSAFNAGSADVHYDKVTIKPDLTPSMDSGQLVHQLLWHVDMDELVVESNTLVGIESYADTGSHQEFYNLPMDKVVIKNLPMITYGAFDKCSNLVEVDMSADAALREIKTEAFLDAEKLHIMKFSPAIKNETVTLGQRILVNTAFETMGDNTKEFDLSAAKFVTPMAVTFAWMPKLRTVDVPNGFNNNTINMATFYNDTKLEEATIGYKITLIDEGAFANDTELKKVFIWGNTIVHDSSLDGYVTPNFFGQGADGDEDDPTDTPNLSAVNPDTLTIPGQADVYAYSVSPTEAYASYSRNAFDGTYYPLDEVLYLTSNKPTVLLNDDETDFDKSDLIVYGLRRDGLVLESDNWAEYDGVVFARSAKPLTFEKMAATIEANPAFGTVYDTPVPISELNFGNENFSEIDFALVPAEDDPNVRIINIVYTDGYTRGTPDTDIDPRDIPDEPEPDIPEPVPDDPEEPDTPDTPKTNDDLADHIALLGGSIAAGLGLIGWNIFTSRKRR